MANEHEELRDKILKIIYDHESSGTSVLINASQMAPQLGRTTPEINDQLEILERDDFVWLAKSHSGDHGARLTPSGKQRVTEGYKPQVATSEHIEDRPSIFLSHSAKDKFFVRKLAERLHRHGVRVWLDEAELKIGDSLTEKIGQAIDETDFVGVVLSHHSVDSEWVQKELQVALQKEFASREITVLPLLLESVNIPPFLRDKVYADFTTHEKFEETFLKVLQVLGVADTEAETPSKTVEVSEPSTSTPAAHRLTQFEDIRIVGLDDEQSYKPDPVKLLYNVYLELSAIPPEEWQAIFAAERQFPRYSMWRPAWIEGQYIVIRCVPEELEEYHLQGLKEDVQNSNNKYRQYLTEAAQKEVQKMEKAREAHNQFTNLKRRLKFD